MNFLVETVDRGATGHKRGAKAALEVLETDRAVQWTCYCGYL